MEVTGDLGKSRFRRMKVGDTDWGELKRNGVWRVERTVITLLENGDTTGEV